LDRDAGRLQFGCDQVQLQVAERDDGAARLLPHEPAAKDLLMPNGGARDVADVQDDALHTVQRRRVARRGRVAGEVQVAALGRQQRREPGGQFGIIALQLRDHLGALRFREIERQLEVVVEGVVHRAVFARRLAMDAGSRQGGALEHRRFSCGPAEPDRHASGPWQTRTSADRSHGSDGASSRPRSRRSFSSPARRVRSRDRRRRRWRSSSTARRPVRPAHRPRAA
jgi:hypothetical protein